MLVFAPTPHARFYRACIHVEKFCLQPRHARKPRQRECRPGSWRRVDFQIQECALAFSLLTKHSSFVGPQHFGVWCEGFLENRLNVFFFFAGRSPPPCKVHITPIVTDTDTIASPLSNTWRDASAIVLSHGLSQSLCRRAFSSRSLSTVPRSERPWNSTRKKRGRPTTAYCGNSHRNFVGVSACRILSFYFCFSVPP